MGLPELHQKIEYEYNRSNRAPKSIKQTKKSKEKAKVYRFTPPRTGSHSVTWLAIGGGVAGIGIVAVSAFVGLNAIRHQGAAEGSRDVKTPPTTVVAGKKSGAGARSVEHVIETITTVWKPKVVPFNGKYTMLNRPVSTRSKSGPETATTIQPSQTSTPIQNVTPTKTVTHPPTPSQSTKSQQVTPSNPVDQVKHGGTNGGLGKKKPATATTTATKTSSNPAQTTNHQTKSTTTNANGTSTKSQTTPAIPILNDSSLQPIINQYFAEQGKSANSKIYEEGDILHYQPGGANASNVNISYDVVYYGYDAEVGGYQYLAIDSPLTPVNGSTIFTSAQEFSDALASQYGSVGTGASEYVWEAELLSDFPRENGFYMPNEKLNTRVIMVENSTNDVTGAEVYIGPKLDATYGDVTPNN